MYQKLLIFFDKTNLLVYASFAEVSVNLQEFNVAAITYTKRKPL